MLEKLREEYAFLERLNETAQKDIALAPPGKLRVDRTTKNPQYYSREKGSDFNGT